MIEYIILFMLKYYTIQYKKLDFIIDVSYYIY